jgi:hypothetical protein
MNYQLIPFEMRHYPQWIVWKFEDVNNKKTKVPYNIKGYRASVTNPQSWNSFDEVTQAVNNGFDGIGFVLTENDPYAFIDLDHTEDQEEFSKQQTIYTNFIDTYAELSPSGKGLHIIMKGRLPQGRRRGSVETYSSQRFMTMTGNVYNSRHIENCQNKLDTLFNSLGKSDKIIQLADEQQHYADNELFEIAYNAENGQKFYDLYNGHWQDYYSSQSEADHALINILSYFSRNQEQIARMFRASALGKRQKAMREDYVGKMIKRSFDNYIPPVDIGAMAENVKNALADTEQNKAGNLNLQLMTLAEMFPTQIAPIDAPLPDLSKTNMSYSEYALDVDFENIPNGLIKELARFIYAQSPRPVKAISTMTALALMSGICGRSYNISGTGLNNYFVLLAPTGIGKEGISKGINKLINTILPQQPLAKTFVGLGELVSGISLLRYLSEETQCCLTVQGEFGMTMQRMTGRNATPNMLQLRKIILDLYGKSGNGEIMRSTVYADKQKNISEIKAPSFTMLAESTPSTFFDALSDGLVDEGLISRFNIVECTAKRPPLNKHHNKVEVPKDLKDYFLNLASNCLTLNATDQVIDIEMTTEAEQVFNAFDKFCDDEINNSPEESYRQLWNRGHLKSLKIASLFAIGVNIYKPVIDKEQALYAIQFVRESIQQMYNRYSNLEIGVDSVSFEKRTLDLTYVVGYILINSKTTNFGNDEMKKDYVIPYKLLQSKCASRKSFKSNEKGGVAQNLKLAIQDLVDAGYLVELKPHVLKEKYNYSGKAWTIANPKHFIQYTTNNPII